MPRWLVRTFFATTCLAILLADCLAAQTAGNRANDALPTTLRLMLQDAETLAQAGDFDIARKLVTAVAAQVNDDATEQKTRELTHRINLLQFGDGYVPDSVGPTAGTRAIVRIPDVVANKDQVVRIARDVDELDRQPPAKLLSHRELTSATKSPDAIERVALKSELSTIHHHAKVRPEIQTGSSLDSLTKSLGISTPPESHETLRQSVHPTMLPTIVINPPAAPVGQNIASPGSAYSSQQVTYFSAICFAIGLLMCPATLLVGMAVARRMAGSAAPLFQISVLREEAGGSKVSQSEPSQPTLTHESPAIREDSVNDDKGQTIVEDDESTEQPDCEANRDSARIIAMSAPANIPSKSKAKKPSDICRQIMDHNLAFRQDTVRTFIDHSVESQNHVH